MKTYRDLTVNEMMDINKLTKGCSITFKRLGELVPIVANRYCLSEKEALEAIKVTHKSILCLNEKNNKKQKDNDMEQEE